MTLRPEPYRHLETNAVFSGLAKLSEEARQRGVDISALAVAWVIEHPAVSAAIIGPRRPAHLEAALTALSVGLSEPERVTLGRFFASVT
jgi:aryl-alcohol dehydrogenase-like predicted oxidoreductase